MVVSHPNRTPEGCGAVASAMVCIVLCVNDVWCMMTACHHLRGGIFMVLRLSPHVADTPVGEIRGYARLQPLPG